MNISILIMAFTERFLRNIYLYTFTGFCLITFNALPTSAQELNHAGILNLEYLNYNSKIPEQLLQERTVVLIDDEVTGRASGKKESNPSPAWQSLASRIHPTFRLLGLDPVAYYNLNLILSGPSVTESFAEDIKRRAITHAIVLKREMIASRDTLFTLILGSLSEDAAFFEAGQSALQIQQNDFNALRQQFTRIISSSGLDKSNFLILEKPEFFNTTEIFTSRRFESFHPDLKLDKLAVPLFEERAIPDRTPPGMSREEITKKVNAENQVIDEANEKLENIMGSYPFSSSPVAYKEGVEAWRKAGNHFVLLSIRGKAETVRELLNYESVDEQPTYTTTKMVDGKAETIEIDKQDEVYKYYIKHLHSGEVYLGTHWDAATTWEQALENFIANLREDFNPKEVN